MLGDTRSRPGHTAEQREKREVSSFRSQRGRRFSPGICSQLRLFLPTVSVQKAVLQLMQHFYKLNLCLGDSSGPVGTIQRRKEPKSRDLVIRSPHSQLRRFEESREMTFFPTTDGGTMRVILFTAEHSAKYSLYYQRRFVGLDP